MRVGICCILFIFLFIQGCKKDDEVTNPTTPSNTVTDIDGNVYHTVTIGTQVWMVENLKTTKYRNGDPITKLTNNYEAWDYASTGMYCEVDNSQSNATTHGRLYNFYAANDSRKITPVGWRVPTSADFEVLLTAVSNNANALKSIGQGTGSGIGTNTSGYTALLSGCRFYGNTYLGIGTNAYFWSSTIIDESEAYSLNLAGDGTAVGLQMGRKISGYSIRCIKE